MWGEDEQGRKSEIRKMNRRNNSKNADRDAQRVLTDKKKNKKKQGVKKAKNHRNYSDCIYCYFILISHQQS